MKNYTLDSLADEVYGGTVAEIAAAAKEHGFLPDETGLIEFPKPVLYLPDDETGEELPVFEVVSVEDAQPTADEEVSQQQEVEELQRLEAERQAEADAGFSPAAMQPQQYTPYSWNPVSGAIRRFGIGTTTAPGPSGWAGNPIRSVTLQARMQPTLGYSAQTRYGSQQYTWNPGYYSTWSPVRAATGTRRTLAFTGTVYAFMTYVWWT